jgi:hypothetical protein
MSDGSVVLVKIDLRTIIRVPPDGRIHVLATLGTGRLYAIDDWPVPGLPQC